MLQYIIKRLLWTLVVLFGVSIITFTILYLLPADPVTMIAGPRASPEVREQIKKNLYLDQPIYIQYGHYFIKLLHGDLGSSWNYHQKVTEALIRHLPYTVALALAGVLFEMLIGLPIGFISAVFQHSILDRLMIFLSLISISMPPFLVGILLLYIVAFKIPIFPVGGYGTPLHLILPGLTIGLTGAAWYARVLRSTILDNMSSEYVRTARAKGLPYRLVLMRHIIPNCLKPIISMFALDTGTFLGGVVVVEAVFGWPGVGLMAWRSILDADMPILMGVVIFAALGMTLLNLLADVGYALVDPRIRYS